ncbi:unnamed protein product [Cylicocyclus nassatus]|uniref:Replication-associated protein ORF2/G2P domain-containing protein n=1 Tax=Cylicocyclus nassatus TaxID=53992 RepID=A0AA36MII2_CYLNA|nr:unnamed protein product [Cylicocyclus nassatus]
MGIPTKVENIEIDATYFRGYNLIWNDWFRSEPLKDPAHIYVDDTNRTGSNGSNYITDAELGGELLPVAKFHDYFTSALPDTQFGPGVTIPIGGTAPVYTAENEIDIKQLLEDGKLSVLKWQRRNGGGTSTTAASSGYRAIMTDSPTPSSTGHYTTYINNNATISSSNADFIIPSNLWADLGETNSINIAALRRAFSIQQWQEALARGGNRYHEIIRSIFNTISPDARQQMPEYLGGFRMPINVTSVLQTSSTDATTPQGNEAGYSITTTQPGGKHLFTYSATEHCRVYILGCCRLRYARDWATRCMMEAETSERQSWFITLTYDDECIPKRHRINTETGEIIQTGYTVCKEDIQKYHKRLREHAARELGQENIKFFTAAEYGDTTFRPHYHEAIFNLEIPDIKPIGKNEYNCTYFESEWLRKIWNHGNITIGLLEWDAAAYIGRQIHDQKTKRTECSHLRMAMY